MNQVDETTVAKLERECCDLLMSVLEIESVSPGDDLFDLGIESYSALEFFTKVNETLGTDCSVSLLFEYPTIAALAEHLAQNITGNES